MARVNKWITARKAFTSLLKIVMVVGGSITASQVADLDAGGETAMVAGLAIVGGVIRGLNNVRKQSNRGNVEYHSLWLVAFALAASGMVSGCVTTTGPDGTVTRQVDAAITDQLTVETAWAIWESIQAERAELEAKKAAAKAEDRAALERQIRLLSRAADDAWNAWLAAGGKVQVRVSAP